MSPIGIVWATAEITMPPLRVLRLLFLLVGRLEMVVGRKNNDHKMPQNHLASRKEPVTVVPKDLCPGLMVVVVVVVVVMVVGVEVVQV